VAQPRWIPLAEIAKPHGIKGELKLRVFNLESDMLLELDEVLIRLEDGTEHEVTVDKARKMPDGVLVKLFSVDDRNRAEELRGAVVCAKREDFPPLDEGEFYACDIVGLPVFVAGSPNAIGTLTDYRSYPSVDIFVVHTPKGDYEVPNIAIYIEHVDVASGRIVLRTLEDLDIVLTATEDAAELT
jgi:16S rRNA processing protein RimM